MKTDTSFLNLYRGMAALWVMVAHCFLWSIGGVDRYNLLEPKKAVDLFMVISGFLMVLTIDRNADRENPFRWHTWRNFYIRRIFRISPVYYLALVAVVLLWPWFSAGWVALESLNPWKWVHDQVYSPRFQDHSPLSMLAHVTYVFGLSPDYSFSSGLPDWSLSLEMQFYAAFPLIYMACRKWPMWRAVLVISVISLVISREMIVGANHGLWPKFDEPSFLLFKLPIFLVGALIYEAASKRRLGNLWLATAVLVLACRGYHFGALFFFLVIASFVYVAITGGPARFQQFTRSKAVSFLSETSYAAYLTHGFVMSIITQHLLRALIAAGYGGLAVAAFVISTVCLTYAISWVIYRTIETGGIKLGKKVIGSRRRIAPAMA